VYRLLTQMTEAVNHGSPSLNFEMQANWGNPEKADSIRAKLLYQENEHFRADVQWNQKRYQVQTDKNETQASASGSRLFISGAGDEQPQFDLLLLIGEILENHPKLAPIRSLGWLERIGLAAKAFLDFGFRQEKWQDHACQVIELPPELLKTGLEIWHRSSPAYAFRLIVPDSNRVLEINIVQQEIPVTAFPLDTTAYQKIEVKRQELNTAIYRGALRTAGILLEDAIRPQPRPAERKWGKGLLTFVDGNRVLIAKGTHRELGEAHGALLKNEIRKMVDATLYTMCWVYTLDHNQWYIDKMRAAYQRLAPFIPPKYQEEMAGLAATSGVPLEEVQLTNVFPALFHCSGFALFNRASQDGLLYHGRVLDYITELGLQYNAVVHVFQPEGSHAFVNVGYAGFIGSVSGMNEHQVAFGEMGGGGQGDWDGMPMGFLMREGLELAQTLDEALAIFGETPRTCEYYYVISDGKIPDARGLATTPQQFVVLAPNQFHPQLIHPMEDVVLMSAGKRYEELAKRVRENYGTFDTEKAIRLMDRPVAMKSNLHDVLFAPQSLELWVANAGANTPACNEPYTHYSFKELLERL